MAALANGAARAWVNANGLAHSGNFDIRIAGLRGPYQYLMPALGVTFDREQLEDVETIDGLPATVVRKEDARNITMTLYDTNNRYLESQIREWMAQASPNLRKARRMSSYAREVTLVERIIQIAGTGNGVDTNIFSQDSITRTAAGAADRAVRPITEEVSLRLAQEAADLQRKFHTGWFNLNIDDLGILNQLPSLRRQLFQNALDSQQFTILERRAVYLAVPVGNIQTNADLTGKGGLANINLNMRIVGEIDNSRVTRGFTST